MSHTQHLLAVGAIVAAMAAATVLLGAPAVRGLFKLVDRRIARAEARTQGITAGKPARPTPQRSIIAAGKHLSGGVWIGLLERLGIFAALLAHFPEGIAMVLGIKGLARYPELQATDTAAAERFIIGTFTSVLVACAGAGLTLWLVGLLP